MDRPSGIRIVIRVSAAVLAVITGAAWLYLAVLVTRSRWSEDPLVDPHGFQLILGTVFAFPLGASCAAVAPFAFAPTTRPRVRRLALAVWALVTVSLFAMWITA